MLFLTTTVNAFDCLPLQKSNVRNNNKYHLLTVKGDTYLQAEIKLKHQLPQIGFLQKVRSEQLRIKSNSTFFEINKIKNTVNANLDMWLKYECKYQGEYYITTVIPKSGIKYVNFDYPKDLNLVNIKKDCGNKKVVILITSRINSFDFHTSGSAWRYKFDRSRRKSRYNHFHVLCGDVNLKLGKRNGRYMLKSDNRFDKFIVIGTYGTDAYPEIKDLTIDFWMELTKDL